MSWVQDESFVGCVRVFGQVVFELLDGESLAVSGVLEPGLGTRGFLE